MGSEGSPGLSPDPSQGGQSISFDRLEREKFYDVLIMG